ncbi:MAG: FIG00876449: hypothetical protein, partial [uncultured Phycisphaerae bacterium]
ARNRVGVASRGAGGHGLAALVRARPATPAGVCGGRQRGVPRDAAPPGVVQPGRRIPRGTQPGQEVLRRRAPVRRRGPQRGRLRPRRRAGDGGEAGGLLRRRHARRVGRGPAEPRRRAGLPRVGAGRPGRLPPRRGRRGRAGGAGVGDAGGRPVRAV